MKKIIFSFLISILVVFASCEKDPIIRNEQNDKNQDTTDVIVGDSIVGDSVVVVNDTIVIQEDTIPTPNYIVFLTIDNVSDGPCDVDVTYGNDTSQQGIFLKSVSIPLTTYKGNTCPLIKDKPTATFAVYSEDVVYFKWTIVNNNKEIAVETPNTLKIIGKEFVHIMTSLNDSIEFTIKEKYN